MKSLGGTIKSLWSPAWLGLRRTSAVAFDAMTIDLDTQDRMQVNLWHGGKPAASYGPFCMLPGDRLILDQIRGVAHNVP